MASSLAFMVSKEITKVSTLACGSPRERFDRFRCIDHGLYIDLGSVPTEPRSITPCACVVATTLSQMVPTVKAWDFSSTVDSELRLAGHPPGVSANSHLELG